MNPFKGLLEELGHICGHLQAIRQLLAWQNALITQVNGRLDRLELWIARHDGAYPSGGQEGVRDLASYRARGVPESLPEEVSRHG